MKNYDYIFIGTGFSSLIFNILSNNKSKIFITSENIDLKKNFFRRKELEHKKLFSNKFNSYGNIKITDFINQKFHDNLSHGGNSNLWGGIIQTSELIKKVLHLNKNIILQSLDHEVTGSSTNFENVYQLQNLNNEILNSKEFIKNPIFGHVIKLKKRNKIFDVFYINKKQKVIKISGKKVFFGVGFVQFLEILINSKFISKNYKISLEEYPMRYNVNIKKKINDKKNFIIKYSLPGVIKHGLGLQKKMVLKFLNFLPLFIDQKFIAYKKKIEFKLCLEKNFLKIIDPQKNFNFGKSIHYCNLKIGGSSAQKFLKKISPNLFGVSMPFVNQSKPGPISSNIVKNIIKIHLNKHFK